MTSDAYRAALKQAKAELLNAVKQRDHWTLEVARLQQLAKSLADSVEKPEAFKLLAKALADTQIGFTEIVNSIVSSSEIEMSATDVRDELLKRGFNFGDRQNPLALIHQTLKRLADQSRVHDLGDGKYKRVMPFFGNEF